MSKNGALKSGCPPVPSSRAKRKRSRCSADVVSGGSTPVRGAKYHCNYCTRDISGLVRIKCAVCSDFDLCLECFSVGVEVHPHKNTHGYRVVDDLSFPLFATNWGADEELLLLEGVDMYGLGNWMSVAEHVGTKPKEECESHYYQVYLKAGVGPAPAPVHAPVEGTLETPSPKTGYPVKSKAVATKEEETGNSTSRPEQSGEGKDRNGPNCLAISWQGEAHDEEVQNTKQKEELLDEGSMGYAGKGGVGTAMKAVGRRSAGTRQDQGGTDEQDEALGGNSYELTGYSAKRDEFDPEYDNEAETCIADIGFNDSDPEDIRDKKLKLLSIYNNRLDERDKRREFIRERKLLNVKKQHALEKKRPSELNELQSRMRVFARHLPQEEHDALVEGLYIERKLREHIGNLKEMRRKGYRTFTDVEAGERESKIRKFYKNGNGVPKPKAMGLQGKTTSTALREWRQKRGVELDITLLGGWQLLSSRERELCANHRFVPAHYLALKDRLLREADKLGYFPRQEVKTFFRLEASKALKVYDLMLACGWVRSFVADSNPKQTRPPEKQNVSEMLTCNDVTVAMHGS